MTDREADVGCMLHSLMSKDDRFRLSHPECGKSLYRPSKNNVVFCAGFTPRLSHEVAHFLEMEGLQRLTMDDFGINSPTAFPTTNVGFYKALVRETRVFAIQDLLRRNSHPIIRMNWTTKALSHIPYGRFRHIRDVKSWFSDLYQRTYKSWNKERVQFEWERRINYLRDWMETE